MPRIDPQQLLQCLQVLLNDRGGIRSEEEVSRVASLMGKFSRKLVSKCIYVLILKHTDSEHLNTFLSVGGWALVDTWLTDAVATKNWPLIIELLDFLLISPMDIEKLKQNNCPKLVKTVSKDSTNPTAKLLATRVVEKWLRIVKGEAVLMTTQQYQQQQDEIAKIIASSTNTNTLETTAGPSIGSKKSDQKIAMNSHEIPPQNFYKSTDQTAAFKIERRLSSGGSNYNQSKDKLKRSLMKAKSKLKPERIKYGGGSRSFNSSLTNIKSSSSVTKELSEKDLQTLAAIKMTQNVAKLGRIPKKSGASSAAATKNDTPAVTGDDDNWDDDDTGNGNGNGNNSGAGNSEDVKKDTSSETPAFVDNDDNWDDDDTSSSNATVTKPPSGANEDPKIVKSPKAQIVKKVGPNASLVAGEPKKPRPVKVYSAKGRSTGLEEEIKRPRAVKKPSTVNGQQKRTNSSKNESIEKKLKDSVHGAVGVMLPSSYVIQSDQQGVSQQQYHPGLPYSQQYETINSQGYRPIMTQQPLLQSYNQSQHDQQTVTLTLPIGYQPMDQTPMYSTLPQMMAVPVDNQQQHLVQRSITTNTFSDVNKSISPTNEYHSSTSTIQESKKKHALQESDLFMESLTASAPKEMKKKRKKAPMTTTSSSQSSSSLSTITATANTLSCHSSIINTSGDETTDNTVAIESPKFYTENLNDSKVIEDGDNTTQSEDQSVKMDDSSMLNTTTDVSLDSGRLVQGVLKMFRKKDQQRKSVRWKADSELIEVQYFEMDESERTNVSKSSADIKQIDMSSERELLNNRISSTDDVMEEKIAWRIPPLITLAPPLAEPGKMSTECETQATRERNVLQTIYFNKFMVPDSPAEPDFEYHPSKEPVAIPLDGVHGRANVKSYRNVRWPEPKTGQPRVQNQTTNENNNNNHNSNNHNHNNNNSTNTSNTSNNKKRPQSKIVNNKAFKKNKSRNQQPNDRICKFYKMNGNCNRQGACPFRHVNPN